MEPTIGQTSYRIPWIDTARGLEILLVMAGHMTSHIFGDSPVGGWIYSFHMPLFFFLSGLLFSDRRTMGNYLLHKVKSLLIPYFLLGIPMAFTASLQQWLEARGLIGASYAPPIDTVSYPHLLLENLRGLVIQKRQWAIWFLAVLFVTEILFYILHRLFPNFLRLTVSVLLITAGGLLYYHLGGQSLPWDIDMVPEALFFYGTGYLSQKIFRGQQPQHASTTHMGRKALRTTGKCLLCLCLWCINILCLHLTWHISGSSLEMFFMMYGFPPLTFLSALAGILAACLSASLLTGWLYRGFFKPLYRALTYIGSHSLLYFAWHETILLWPLREMFRHIPFFAAHPSGPVYWLQCILMLLIMSTVLTLLDRLIRRTPLRVMVTGSIKQK